MATFVVEGQAVRARVKSAHIVILLVMFRARKNCHASVRWCLAGRGSVGGEAYATEEKFQEMVLRVYGGCCVWGGCSIMELVLVERSRW